MTMVQHIMLSMCFGAVMGMFLADVGFLIKYAIDKHKEKKRKKNEESADKAEVYSSPPCL